MNGFVYILQSQKNNRYYIGSTIDLEKRIIQHQNSQVKATKHIQPTTLVFQQEFTEIKQARRIEYKLKKLKRRDIIERIIKERKIKII